jgi:hypothetical protein
MKKLIKFPSIDQFRNVIKAVQLRTRYVGKDDTGESIYDPSIPLPKLNFIGTVKLHGTNASIAYNREDGLWTQSRENLIEVGKDNAGFAFYVESHRDRYIELFKMYFNQYLDQGLTVVMYGEWVGKGIQKGVGISEIEKSFFLFAVKIAKPQDEEFVNYWVDNICGVSDEFIRFYNIFNYPTYEVEIDFNSPQLIQNKLIELTEEVEKECPVAKIFGISGIGEGLVFTCKYKDEIYRFKSKGEKHSVSKVKKLNSVDVEKLKSIDEFVDYAVTENRFEQAIQNVFPNKEGIDVKNLGDVIRWIVQDILKEELDTLAGNNLEPKDVNSKIAQKTREMFFRRM